MLHGLGAELLLDPGNVSRAHGKSILARSTPEWKLLTTRVGLRRPVISLFQPNMLTG